MLEAVDLMCIKGDRLLFQGLNLTLTPNMLLQVQGENGFGKSSLLRLLCGLTRPELGTITWCQQPIHKIKDSYYRQLLYIGHTNAVNSSLTAYENLMFNACIMGEQQDEQAIMTALITMGLAGQLDLPISVLSQGQKRRVVLSKLLLAKQRQVWILDEPFAALDKAAVDQLIRLITAHCQGGGSVILTSHQTMNFDYPVHYVDLQEYKG